jgi:hypothetical protein
MPLIESIIASSGHNSNGIIQTRPSSSAFVVVSRSTSEHNLQHQRQEQDPLEVLKSMISTCVERYWTNDDDVLSRRLLEALDNHSADASDPAPIPLAERRELINLRVVYSLSKETATRSRDRTLTALSQYITAKRSEAGDPNNLFWREALAELRGLRRQLDGIKDWRKQLHKWVLRNAQFDPAFGAAVQQYQQQQIQQVD